ncbi:MAG: UDP-N-acetylmuramate dehydrogenase [Candidatus Paceibacterota bacterium]|jgi:UDP-N-acetylmuramate dehydrogenase
MIEIKEKFDISKLNTFGVSAVARFFVEINSEDDIQDLFKNEIFKNNERLFLGGGSNILFTKNFDGIVILSSLKGIEIVKEDENFVEIRAMGGEMWNDLVIFSVDKGYWGIENLTLIPGTVGASPIQNIGAYGTEVKDVIVTVEGYEINTGDKKVFTNQECNFGYRDSVFKNSLKGRYFISAITIRLFKKRKEGLEYKAIVRYLEENKVVVNSSKDISQAVANIRKSKLPDPKIIGNAGSFFKNVFVSEEKFKELLLKYPEMPFFQEEDSFKIPSAWLIEQCGFKGKREGNVGMHEKQALVLVNHGGASGEEIKSFAEKIQKAVLLKFDLVIFPEVNLI